MIDENDKKRIQEMIDVSVAKAVNYPTRKRGDTPTDDLQLTPKGYVNLNGTVGARPIGSVASIGQKYFATDTNIPMTFTGTQWVDGIGSVVALN